jgi:early secretory antigenic target protein ESAT-6
MMNDGIRVNHAGLDTGASDLATGVKQIEDRMNRLEDDLKELKGAWVGDAKDSYAIAKAKWDQAILEMKDLLQRTSLAVSQANQDYRSADQRGASLFNG